MRRDKLLLLDEILASKSYTVDVEKGEVFGKNDRLKSRMTKTGLKNVDFYFGGKNHSYTVASVIAFAAGWFDDLESPESYQVICKDGDKANTSLPNLMLVTLSEKAKYYYEKGHMFDISKANISPKLKYTRDFVRKIREDYYDKHMRVAKIAKENEVPYSSISDIIHFKNQFSVEDYETWKDKIPEERRSKIEEKKMYIKKEI